MRGCVVVWVCVCMRLIGSGGGGGGGEAEKTSHITKTRPCVYRAWSKRRIKEISLGNNKRHHISVDAKIIPSPSPVAQQARWMLILLSPFFSPLFF